MPKDRVSEAVKLLGVKRSINKKELKKIWRKLALETHPDRHPDKENLFKKYKEAYDILSNKWMIEFEDYCQTNNKSLEDEMLDNILGL